MFKVISILLVVVGIINFLPVLGVVSAARLTQAYSIDIASNDLVILMRHRALLFGLVGGFILYSVFIPSYQSAAMVMAGISMVGYLFLVWDVGGYNESLFKIAIVDGVGILCLALALLLKIIEANN